MTDPGGRLVARVLELLRQGPRSSEQVARDVLGLSGPVPLLETTVRTLLAGDPRVRESPGGGWCRSSPSDGESGLDHLPWVVVDVETTGGGGNPDHRITEVAAVEIRDGSPGKVFHALVNPGRSIPRRITGLTGIDDRMVANAPPFGFLAPGLSAFLEGRIFVAHNAAFDWGFLRREFDRNGFEMPAMARACTVTLTRRLIPGLPRYDLGTVTRSLGIPIEDRHRALGDARATALLLVRLLERAGELEIRDLPGLMAFRPPRRARTPRTRKSEP